MFNSAFTTTKEVYRDDSGFTLIECLLSIGIISVIMLGLQSAMLLASRSAPGKTSGFSTALQSGRAIDQLSSDLTYATSISTATPTSVEFTVPDRNSDGQPELIRYSWSGVAGAGLLRTMNNGSSAAVASNVNELQFFYDKKSKPRTPTLTESSETLLASNDGAGILNLGNFAIDSNSFCGQTFTPTLPGAASQWRVTRILIHAQKHGGNVGQSRIQIRALNGTKPGIVVDETLMNEADLSGSYSWKQFTFSNASGFLPGAGAAIVIQWVSDVHSCDIEYQALLATASNTNFVTTNNGGSTWSAPLAQDMIFYAYGTYSTTDPVITDYWLTGVRCVLRMGADTAGRVRTTIRTMNQPQVSGP